MRIFLIGTHPTIQGPIASLVQLMKEGLEELGCEVRTGYWGRHREGEPFLEKFLVRPLDVWPLVWKILSGKHDVIFLNTSHDWPALIRDIPLVAMARLARIPLVVLYHGTCAAQLLDPSKAWWRRLFAWRLKNSVGLFVLAGSEASAIHKLWPNYPVATVRYPVATVRLPAAPIGPDQSPGMHGRPKGQACYELVFVGRLMRTKGIMDLLAAMPRVVAELPCHLDVLGAGPLKEQALEEVRQAGLGAHVTFRGYLSSSEVHDVLTRADLFVLPTYHTEGFPVAVLEALTVGLPVVVAPAGGMEDWLKPGIHAQYVPPRNPEALAQQIVALLKNPEQREKMRAANLELVKQFAPRPTMAEYLCYLQTWCRPPA